jgi:hypothetical protein
MAVAFPISAGQKLTAAVINHQYSIADTAVTTVTAAGPTSSNLSTVYVIPANDAAVGMAYRLTCGGDGQQGSTRQILHFNAGFGGASVGFDVLIDPTALAVSATFRWNATIMVIPITIGGSATLNNMISGCVTQAAYNIIPGTAANNSIPFGGANITATTGDTTIANNFALRFQWGSTTGAPTITSRFTVFERLG